MKTLKFYSLLFCLLSCSSFLFSQVNGISILDVKTGVVTEAFNLGDSPAYNPTFSNNGKKIAFDTFGGYNGVYITDLSSWSSYPLPGGEGGNDASWSPDGKNIVFDRDGFQISYVPAGGGDPTFVAYGTDAEWNNTSKKIVYSEFGILKTVNIDGSGATTVSYFGLNPSWSPNGNHIAFSDGENLWMVDVDDKGNALGAPNQITFEGPDIYNQQPSWSNNSKSLVFHSNRTTSNYDFDIWSIKISNGAISRMTGFVDIGDYDPCYSKNGQYVAFITSGSQDQATLRRNASATLHQNLPNPFNNSTSIKIEMEKKGEVQMFVYDQLGRLVNVLLNSELEAGVHEVNWNPSLQNESMTTGIYIIQMITSEGIQTKKMLYNPN